MQVIPVFGAEFRYCPGTTVGMALLWCRKQLAIGVEEVPESMVSVYLDFAALFRVEDRSREVCQRDSEPLALSDSSVS